MNQVDKKICIDLIRQIIITLNPIDISKERKRDLRSRLDQNELKSLKTVIGQLGWNTGQTRPDYAFALVCSVVTVRMLLLMKLFKPIKF